ncbi:MAG TPA: hypothetical protein VME69_12980 [Methylocella sp.]|nr:hypothetical protein [Methylocella sp.]
MPESIILTDTGQTKQRWPDEPYRGLDFIQMDQAALLAERDQDLDACGALLCHSETRVLWIQGFSGSGKTSFIHAGLCPWLAEQRDFCMLPDRGGKPAIIRCTEAPVSLLRHALVEAMANDRFRGSLGDPGETDRRVQQELVREGDLAGTTLAALRAITGRLRGTLILMFDQAEEVLTLEADGKNRAERPAFFLLLRRLCQTGLGLRVVMALRTEFYGQFCNELRISPNLSVSTVKTGLQQFMLSGALTSKQIEHAILRPTCCDPIPGSEKLGPPSDYYRFKYEDGLARAIARDIHNYTARARLSALPVMQIVCRELWRKYARGRPDHVLTRTEYVQVESVENAIETFVEAAIEQALRAAKIPSPETRVDAWQWALASLADEQAGGSTVSLIRTADQLVERAREAGHAAADDRVVQCLAIDESSLLRRIGSSPGVRRYSLRHDIAAMHLARWRTGYERSAKERKEAKRQLEKSRRNFRNLMLIAGLIAGGIVSVLLVVLGLLVPVFLEQQHYVGRLTTYAQTEPSSDYRLRIMALLQALRGAGVGPKGNEPGIESWIWRNTLGPEAIRTQLEGVLLRSPLPVPRQLAIGADQEGERLTSYRLIPNEQKPNEQKKYEIETTQPMKTVVATSCPLNLQDTQRPIRAAGFLLDGSEEIPAVAEWVEKNVASGKGQTEHQVSIVVHRCYMSDVSFDVDTLHLGSLDGKIPVLRITGGSVRLWLMKWDATEPEPPTVVDLHLQGGHLEPRVGAFQPHTSSGVLPVLTPCGLYASLGRDLKDFRIGRIGDTSPKQLPFPTPENRSAGIDQTYGGQAFSLDCRWLAVHVDPSLAHQKDHTVELFGPIDTARLAPPAEQDIAIPNDLDKWQHLRWGNLRPPHALENHLGRFRMAWYHETPSQQGDRAAPSQLVVVEWKQGKSNATPIAGTAPLLFGQIGDLPPAAPWSRLFFADAGNLLISQTDSFGDEARRPVHVWDLDFAKRMDTFRAMSIDKLWDTACQVAATDVGGKLLNSRELLISSPIGQQVQPCGELP